MIVKAGDRYPVRWRANMDLSGASVRLVVKPRRGEPVVLATEIEDAADGVVAHTLTGDLPVGTYSVELEVALGSEIITFPSGGSYTTLRVIPDLD